MVFFGKTVDIAIRSSTYQPKTYVNMEQLKSENILLSNHKGRFYIHPQFSSHPNYKIRVRRVCHNIFWKGFVLEHSAYAYKICNIGVYVIKYIVLVLSRTSTYIQCGDHTLSGLLSCKVDFVIFMSCFEPTPATNYAKYFQTLNNFQKIIALGM